MAHAIDGPLRQAIINLKALLDAKVHDLDKIALKYMKFKAKKDTLEALLGASYWSKLQAILEKIRNDRDDLRELLQMGKPPKEEDSGA